jgi:predicted phosphodiesterase
MTGIVAILITLWLALVGAATPAVATPTPYNTADHSVLIGAGDICVTRDPFGKPLPGGGNVSSAATAKLIEQHPDAVVFAAGDYSNDEGTAAQYAKCPWNEFMPRLYPVMGNHDEQATGGQPYFQFFGSNAGPNPTGWYSYNMANNWHVVVLNSNCNLIGGCGRGSPEEKWLVSDLAANKGKHIIAMWHHPLFTSGANWSQVVTPPAGLTAWWDDLLAAHASIVINGHSHTYEAFAPQNASGEASKTGIREFVVGTGGATSSDFWKAKRNSVTRISGKFGVLKLTLDATSYSWQFIETNGKVASSGTAPAL